ncbi:hypothetical protein SEA_FLAGSTAFF_55 [Mycobacterium phage FlagStaff]|uniref:Uncharacterized protein n=1 Tax=Mycobacterium phage FlagStaff TaxID=1647304 RepID=A0A0F6SJM8_9CAUD|nr:hypothetical protein AVT49_gp55 [Mycobacterium phage FlagStaff]AKF14492.1 hypothetical protein SEA_FLAGSTAFF_55 [Mycobacterium phage FlagStaff]
MLRVLRGRYLAGLMFVAWMLITALRSRYAHPYELLWWTGIVAAGAAMFAAGWIWRGTRGEVRRRRETRV